MHGWQRWQADVKVRTEIAWVATMGVMAMVAGVKGVTIIAVCVSDKVWVAGKEVAMGDSAWCGSSNVWPCLEGSAVNVRQNQIVVATRGSCLCGSGLCCNAG